MYCTYQTVLIMKIIFTLHTFQHFDPKDSYNIALRIFKCTREQVIAIVCSIFVKIWHFCLVERKKMLLKNWYLFGEHIKIALGQGTISASNLHLKKGFCGKIGICSVVTLDKIKNITKASEPLF